MLVNAFAIALLFGTLPLTSMMNSSASIISISGPTRFEENQESGALSAPEKSPQPLTVTGTLHQSVGMGGESSGWTIVLDSKVKVDGKLVDSIEVQGSNKKLESLSDQRVKISGVIVHKTGVERGRWPVLRIQKIEKAKAN
jgi:hypothetical protein